MAERSEVYVIHKDTGVRKAVPRKVFDTKLKGDGYVIDPDVASNAAVVDTRTVKASERAIETAQAKKTTEAEA